MLFDVHYIKQMPPVSGAETQPAKFRLLINAVFRLAEMVSKGPSEKAMNRGLSPFSMIRSLAQARLGAQDILVS